MDRYCVIGDPIAHSKSPHIHTAFAAQTGQQLSYERCLPPAGQFVDTVRNLIAQGYKGANVTMPFKLDAAAMCLTLSPRARAAGAVNTMSFIGTDIVGDNTDGPGLVNDIVRNAGVQLAGKRVLLLGAGGAARGVILPLLGEQPQAVVIANRTVATAEALAAQFAGDTAHSQQLAARGYDQLGADAPFDVVVNATSAGFGAAMPPVPASVFGPGTLALDMMYGRDPSLFMQFAAQHGANVRDGLGMLVEQAAESFFIWRGVRPATETILSDLRQKL
ncbi:shikimate dehydrogenase [Massilia arenosa]|uniref:Shikimate dehydrogenase (NADP(+)) n=1 Tax=Zemynaea arenosa TaxID=2561931 RepID=A0A4Y9ST06_9BURK|nr:shikimate dehydrogenase [Massilia arenosa]TFW28354.1 shikimate dehydrogenase [Massilia arenosa]